MEDSKIVDLYWQRSESAISETQHKYEPYCFSIAKNILPAQEDAQECVNDTYLAAWNAMPPSRPTVLSTFLGKLTRRISIDRWRNMTAEKRGGGVVTIALDELAECIPNGSNPEAEVEAANPLTGILYCADCGAKMYNHRSTKQNKNGSLYHVDFYNCANYTLTLQRETKKCCSHSITTKAVRSLILDTIQTVSTYAIANEADFKSKVLEASRIKQDTEAKDMKKKIARAKKRSAELDVLIKKLYESYAMGKIQEKRFDMLSAEYEQEQAALEAIIASDLTELDVFTSDADRAQKFLTLARKYTDFTELTTPMINEFVEKIIVHAPEKIDGERTMELEVHLKFIGKFDIPISGPTPEELAAEEAARQKRAKERAKYERRKERKRLQKLAAEQSNETSETV